jgi:hypothetical protein
MTFFLSACSILLVRVRRTKFLWASFRTYINHLYPYQKGYRCSRNIVAVTKDGWSIEIDGDGCEVEESTDLYDEISQSNQTWEVWQRDYEYGSEVTSHLLRVSVMSTINIYSTQIENQIWADGVFYRVYSNTSVTMRQEKNETTHIFSYSS